MSPAQTESQLSCDLLLERASNLLREALGQGADEAQVISRGAEETKVRYEKNDFTCTSTNGTLTLSLKVYCKGKKGTASTNDLGADALKDTAQRAIALASFSLEDEHLCLPADGPIQEVPGRYDEHLANLSAADLHELAADFIEVAKADQRISLDGGQVEVTKYCEALVNSNGLSRTDQITRLDWTLMGLGKTETETTSFDYLSGSSWKWDGAAALAKQTAEKLVASILGSFCPSTCASYKGQVLLSPGVVSSLLLQPISYHVGGAQLMDGKSLWEESLGKVVASTNFTLVDSAHNTDLMGASPYDSEGVATHPITVIKDGVLSAHVDSTYTAKRRGTTSTGHAGGFHTLEVGGGQATKQELLGSPERLVVVERFSGNVDPLTGDFSGIAKGSHYYEKGELKYALSETMIAGNFFEMIKSIQGMTKNPEPYCGQYIAPWILVDGISVTGTEA
ncbi:MAG: PmbA protein [Planctomycetota bacterium]